MHGAGRINDFDIRNSPQKNTDIPTIVQQNKGSFKRYVTPEGGEEGG